MTLVMLGLCIGASVYAGLGESSRWVSAAWPLIAAMYVARGWFASRQIRTLEKHVRLLGGWLLNQKYLLRSNPEFYSAVPVSQLRELLIAWGWSEEDAGKLSKRELWRELTGGEAVPVEKGGGS